MEEANSQIEQAIGGMDQVSGKGFLGMGSNIYEGGFAGISQEGIGQLKDYIDEYASKLEKIISEFNADAPLKAGLADGSEAQKAASSFIVKVKDFLIAYVNTVRIYGTRAQEAYENYKKADVSIGGSTDDTAKAVESSKSSIELD